MRAVQHFGIVRFVLHTFFKIYSTTQENDDRVFSLADFIDDKAVAERGGRVSQSITWEIMHEKLKFKHLQKAEWLLSMPLFFICFKITLKFNNCWVFLVERTFLRLPASACEWHLARRVFVNGSVWLDVISAYLWILIRFQFWMTGGRIFADHNRIYANLELQTEWLLWWVFQFNVIFIVFIDGI